jgi:hypothetical protein
MAKCDEATVDGHEICLPGQHLFVASDGYRAGNGCFELNGTVFASLAGFVHIFPFQDQVSSIFIFIFKYR